MTFKRTGAFAPKLRAKIKAVYGSDDRDVLDFVTGVILERRKEDDTSWLFLDNNHYSVHIHDTPDGLEFSI